MNCWICGDVATTGEHRIKHSDLKQLYPEINQKFPLYHRRDGINQRPIGSLKSNHLKFDALLCAKCNNEITQKFDLAWEKLSSCLQKNWDTICVKGQINLYEVFPENTIHHMTYVQLFFVKIFGCYIKESGANVCLESFSKVLLSKLEHPSLYFSFRESHIATRGNYSSISDLEIFHEDNNPKNIYYAHMFYTLDRITVDLIYCPDSSIINLNGAVKPSQILDNTLQLSKLTYESTLPEYIQSNIRDNIDRTNTK